MTAQPTFRSAGYSWRLFCGPGVIESNLKATVRRAGARRAFAVCSPSVNRRTNTIQRIQTALGEDLVGVFDGVENDSSYASVEAGRAAAEAAEADLLIAVGGGSVIVAARAIAIFMAEPGDPFQIMTQYPEDGRPYSPRLEAPKPPIVNVPTTPTSAMNRAGTGLKNADLDHRMEYFDPKTRPQGIFLDDEALLTAPPPLVRSTATTLFAGLLGAVAQPAPNPLVAGDQDQAFRLADDAYRCLMHELDNPEIRRNLALAAFLQNRAEDDGRPMRSRSPFAGDYAVATALHLRYPHIGQGEATSVLQPHAIRLAAPVDADAAARAASALGVWRADLNAKALRDAVAAALTQLYADVDLPGRLRDLGVAAEDLGLIAAETVKNFNASGDLASAESRVAHSMRVLEAAW